MALKIAKENDVIKNIADIYVKTLAFNNWSASSNLNISKKKVPKINNPNAPINPIPRNIKNAVFTTSLTFSFSPFAWYSAINFTKEVPIPKSRRPKYPIIAAISRYIPYSSAPKPFAGP